MHDEALVDLGRRYFSKLDLQFNPAFLLDQQRLRQTGLVLKLLKKRVLLRRFGDLPKKSNLVEVERSAVASFSGLMIALLKDHFGFSPGNPHCKETIGRTHDLFAWGGLASRPLPGARVPNNVPDGAAIFFFPEFGHLAIENEVDAESWHAILDVLTRMPALYIRAYALRDPTRVPQLFDDFGPPPFDTSNEASLRRYSTEFELRYRDKPLRTLGAALGALAARAFSDPVSSNPSEF